LIRNASHATSFLERVSPPIGAFPGAFRDPPSADDR
jgi:hypothetical protein